MADKDISAELGGDTNAKPEAWVKPEIVSFKPVEAAEGISYRPSDGLSNLTA
ncbi:hypothetical protein [Novosphingobium sp. TH158]|uniref:hypothetical protein n=1 Tax=Novosphingobium sp. TH158 TaxID=2067455 RepID=UPI0013041A8E|nr:hypothetical protein [Novosphingobium sp. TH158]